MTDDFRVGPWLVKPSLNVISRNGTTVRLEPRVMEVLVCLAGHAGEALPKETLLQTVWPDTFVSEDVLKRCISELRRVFEDDAREPRIIETIPKRGYRLVAPVEPVTGTKEPPAPSSSMLTSHESAGSPVRLSRRGSWMGAVAIVGAVVITAFLIALRASRSARASAAPGIRSLAVLPLQNLSADPTQEYFSEGMTDALITELSHIDSVRVVSRTSSMQYKQTKKSLPEIAHELNVDGIVEGTVQRSGDRVRITAQFIQAPSDKHLWANSYERDLRDVFALEREVTDDIAREIQAKIGTSTQAPPAAPRPVNPKALEAYWQGEYYSWRAWNGGLEDQEKSKALASFQKAVAADPNFAPAYAAMVYAYYVDRPTKEGLDSMTAAAEKAVALDPKLAEAHVALGDVKWAAGAWQEAEQHFRTAIALSPNYVRAHESLGNILDVTGRFDEGLKEQEIAQVLDPAGLYLGLAYYRRAQYDRSIEIDREFLRSHPQANMHWYLALDYLQKRMAKEWAAELGAYMAVKGFPEVGGNLQRAAALGGYQGALRQWAKELERLHDRKRVYWPGVAAQAYSMLGDKNRAFYWLEDAYSHRLETYDDFFLWGGMRIDPGFSNLRSDPRLNDLLRRVGLPEVQTE